jgi:hypothetical protein
MCGIFCNIYNDELSTSLSNLEFEISTQVKNASLRGSESVGLAIIIESYPPIILKSYKKPLVFIKSDEYSEFLKKVLLYYNKSGGKMIVLGQCRLANSGTSVDSDAIQPIVRENTIGVFNGLVTEFSDISSAKKLSHESDTKVLFDEIEEILNKNKDLQSIYENKGSVNFITYSRLNSKVFVGSNMGSLYLGTKEKNQYLASEKIFLEKIKTKKIKKIIGVKEIFEFESEFKKSFIEKKEWQNYLVRCNKCILPETYPGINFDSLGICNLCNSYRNQKFLGKEKLEKFLLRYKKKNGNDCIVGLSGGRDSCYALYYLKEVMGMNPVAYTYDWGLTTEKSRRNQSIICEKLGVEHIIRSADLEKKRRYVRKNVNAWLNRPHLGMVPLFMAGDKDFFEFGRSLSQDMNIDLTVMGSGHQMEQREFMVGFTGLTQPTLHDNPDFYHHPSSIKIRLAAWYCLQYLKNPQYINESFYDSVRSYIISFFKRTDNFLYLFRYIPWNESEIEEILFEKYGLEKDSKYGENQWRMGDGQTAFNNFIYYHIAGLTEYDTFRSHQVREGLISREEAMALVKEENKPKYQSIKEFCDTIGLSFEETIRRILIIPSIRD